MGFTERYRIQIHHAVAALAAGGVIAYPTETVYGLGCDAFDEGALSRLLAMKQRAPHKGLIVIAADIEMLQDYVAFPRQRLAEVQQSWPGPTTWLVPVKTALPYLLTGGRDTLAVRVTSHPVARALCRCWGNVIVSTSANMAGRPVARNGFVLRRQFHNRVDVIVPGTPGPHRGPSCIRDARSGAVIRAA